MARRKKVIRSTRRKGASGKAKRPRPGAPGAALLKMMLGAK